MHIIKTLIAEFGVLGWTELFAALLVASGCGGELWIILNKLTRHIEPLPKNIGVLWKVIASTDAALRPIVVRLKVSGRRLPEAKEQLLERLFVMLVALGVGIELICLTFSLHEIASLNKQAGDAVKDAANANKLAGLANEQAAFVNGKTEALRNENLKLKNELEKQKPRELTDGQKSQGKSILSQYKGTLATIRWMEQDADTDLLAYALNDLLTNSGWKVTMDMGFLVRGSGIVVSPAREVDLQAATSLLTFFKGCNFAVQYGEPQLMEPNHGKWSTNAIAPMMILIGYKGPTVHFDFNPLRMPGISF